MISVNFVCLGNICRSPMAELVFKKLVKERGIERSFDIKSFGTSNEEEGNHIYPPAKRTLAAHGIYGDHIARQLTLKDVINSDYILVMNTSNLSDVLRLTGGEYRDKIFKLCAFTSDPRDVADPWYTSDFERAFTDIYDGVNCFLEYVLKKHKAAIEYDKLF